jgi:UDP-glucose:(heptosyl)LPS alpha-1,3-glucosyltransferase
MWGTHFMKVALVHMRQSEVGGTERYLNQIASFLARQGDEVTIVCRRHEAKPHESVRLAVLRPLTVGAAWRMWAFAQAVERYLADNAFDVVFGLGKTWSQDVLRLGGGLHQTYLDLAHGSRRARAGMPGGISLKHRLALRVERRAFTAAGLRRVITNSDMVKRDVVARHGFPESRVTVVYNGVDIGRFHPQLRNGAGLDLRRQCGFADDECVLLFLGNEYGRKGLGELLDLLPEVFRQRPSCRLLVAGYDSHRARYEQDAIAAGLGDRIRFIGGRRDPQTCFAAADVYVLPTLYDPFANSTLEALACGTPVITTTANGASEILGREGSAVASDSPAALLTAILDWTLPARFREARHGARALAEKFTDIRTASATRAVLEEVALEKHPQGRALAQ